MQAEQYALHADIETRHWWFAARRRIVERLVERLVPPSRDSIVLDVGCGTGANVAAFADRYACRGMDSSPDAIEHARSRFPSVEFACEADFARRTDWLERANVVLLMDVLEHVEDDFLFLSRMLAPLAPGTKVLITVPADGRLWTAHDESFGHWRRYDLARLAATWNGLAVSERLHSAYNARLYPVIRAVRAVTSARGKTAGRAGTDFSMPPAFANRWLEDLFAGECARLERALDRGGPAYSHGASLIAVLERRPGTITPRARPASIQPDVHRPAAHGS
jgi:2-polyprenyl-3-methyl-5-hydroxy-6-metoxy-1,4-benzoquinol methylase